MRWLEINRRTADRARSVAQFMRLSNAWPRNDAFADRCDNALTSLASVARGAPGSYQPPGSGAVRSNPCGRSTYERPKHRDFALQHSLRRREQSGRRPSGCRANQVAARSADPVHAAAALGAERPQPAGDCRHDHVRRAVSRPSRPGCARRRVARLPVCDADPAHGGERHGWRRFVGDRARARRRQARCRRCARVAHVGSGPWPCGGILDRAAARRAIRLSMDGRARRNTVGRARLRERGVQRRRVDLHAESARQRGARNRQHGSARRRHRRQRDRARADLAAADFRMGTGAGPRSRPAPAGA